MAGGSGVNGSGKASLQASPAAAALPFGRGSLQDTSPSATQPLGKASLQASPSAAPPFGRSSLSQASPSAATAQLRGSLQASPSAPSLAVGCGVTSSSSAAAAVVEEAWVDTNGEGDEGQYVCQVSCTGLDRPTLPVCLPACVAIGQWGQRVSRPLLLAGPFSWQAPSPGRPLAFTHPPESLILLTQASYPNPQHSLKLLGPSPPPHSGELPQPPALPETGSPQPASLPAA